MYNRSTFDPNAYTSLGNSAAWHAPNHHYAYQPSAVQSSRSNAATHSHSHAHAHAHSQPLSNPFVLPSSAAQSSYHHGSFYQQSPNSASDFHVGVSNKDAGSMLVDAAHSLGDHQQRGAHSIAVHSSSAAVSGSQKKSASKRSSTKAVGPSAPPKPAKRKRSETPTKKSKSRVSPARSRKSSRPIVSSSDDSESSDVDSSSDNNSSDSDHDHDSHTPNPYLAPSRPTLSESKEAKESMEEAEAADPWTAPEFTTDIANIQDAFKQLMQKWPVTQKTIYEKRKKEIFKSQLKVNITKNETLLISVLRRAAKVYNSLSPEKNKIERDLIVALFAAELPRQLTMSLFELSAWTIQRIISATENGENIGTYIDKWKAKVKPVSTTHADGSVSVHFTSKTRTRVCKLTGRTMKEEKDIAASYYDKAENLNKDIIAIYAHYLQDMTGGDSNKRAPLSRANFYQLAPEGKRRKQKPEILKISCEHCEKPMRIRVEEEEVPVRLAKKKKVRRLKQMPLTDLLVSAVSPASTAGDGATQAPATGESMSSPSPPVPSAVPAIARTDAFTTPVAGSAPSEESKESSKETKRKKKKEMEGEANDDMFETVEVIEMVDGPPRKRIKVEVLRKGGQVVQADREVPAASEKKSSSNTGESKPRKVKTEIPAPATTVTVDSTPPPLDQYGNPIYTKRGPGRSKRPWAKSESQNLTQQMAQLLPLLTPPVSTLTEEQRAELSSAGIGPSSGAVRNISGSEAQSLDAVIAAMSNPTPSKSRQPEPRRNGHVIDLDEQEHLHEAPGEYALPPPQLPFQPQSQQQGQVPPLPGQLQ